MSQPSVSALAPWTSDPSWFVRYARTAAQIKNSSHPQPGAIRAAFRTVYRAVAFDIDGTLTGPGASEVTPAMADIVTDLLRRSVPVVLITGRGRSARTAVEQIYSRGQLSETYLKRLYCIIYNGILLLEHDPAQPGTFLATERQLGSPFAEVLKLRDTIQSIVGKLPKENPPTIVLKEQSIRLLFRSAEQREAAETMMGNSLAEYMTDNNLHLMRGSFEDLYCLDIGPGSKAAALAEFGDIIGVHPDAILRIGDQGSVGGNDHDLLDHPRGFSVDRLGTDPATCHPVLDDSLKRPLTGARAAEALLGLVLLFPPLSLAPSAISSDRLRALNQIERAAIPAARAAFLRATAGLNETLSVFDCRPKWSPFEEIQISDVLDPMSGAVRFREWELQDVSLSHPAAELFGLPQLLTSSGLPRTRLCMYSDTGVLLRGPDYYRSWTEPNISTDQYIEAVQFFVKRALDTVIETGQSTPSFSLYKLTLGILDNIRNHLLCLSNLSFVVEGEQQETTYPFTSTLLSTLVLRHTRLYLEAVRGGRGGWQAFHQSLAASLQAILDCMSHADLSMLTNSTFPCKGAIRTRECDNFVENVVAVSLGLQKHLRYPPFATCRSLRVVGLAYGGLELPIIATALGSELGADIEPAIIRVSFYENPELGASIRGSAPGYVDELLKLLPPVCLAGDREKQVLSDRPAIIADDNSTTCLTLQWARDALISLGADIRGAIIVRYPRSNRALQMRMPKHGMPDPEILLGFVRGLVSPSPYSRLLVPGDEKGNIYRDQTNVFDKAKERLIRYLKKNGTPRL